MVQREALPVRCGASHLLQPVEAQEPEAPQQAPYETGNSGLAEACPPDKGSKQHCLSAAHYHGLPRLRVCNAFPSKEPMSVSWRKKVLTGEEPGTRQRESKDVCGEELTVFRGLLKQLTSARKKIVSLDAVLKLSVGAHVRTSVHPKPRHDSSIQRPRWNVLERILFSLFMNTEHLPCLVLLRSVLKTHAGSSHACCMLVKNICFRDLGSPKACVVRWYGSLLAP